LDHERVYNSDLKKLVQWFSILRENNAFPLEHDAQDEEAPAEDDAPKEVEVEAEVPKAKAKKAAAKKPAAKKPAAKKPAAKKPAAKKTAAKKPAAK